VFIRALIEYFAATLGKKTITTLYYKDSLSFFVFDIQYSNAYTMADYILSANL